MNSPGTTAIPSASKCLSYFDQFEMLDNIRQHSILVAQVAATLIDCLGRAGRCPAPLPTRAETVAGALLHDIAKTLCIKTGCHHAEIGRQICVDLGYPEIGAIVAEHVVLQHFHADLYQRGLFGAKELVFYADKRVLHDQVVPLASRLEYILKRYGDGDGQKEQYIRMNFNRTVDFEKYLFNFLDLTPDTLVQHVVPIEEIF